MGFNQLIYLHAESRIYYFIKHRPLIIGLRGIRLSIFSFTINVLEVDGDTGLGVNLKRFQKSVCCKYDVFKTSVNLINWRRDVLRELTFLSQFPQ